MAHFQKPDGTKITFDGWIEIEMYSPLFNDTNTYSLPCTIPATDDNRKALDFPEEINSADNKVRENDVVFVSETLRLYGKSMVEQPNDEFYEASFIGQGAFRFRYGGLSLREFDLPDEVFPAIIDAIIYPASTSDFVHNSGGINICFPCFLNLKYYESFDFYNSEVDVRTEDVNYIELMYQPIGGFRYRTAEIPAIELKTLLLYLFEQLNINVGSDFLADSVFDNLYLLSNYDVTEVNFREDSTDIYLSQLQIIDDSTIRITIPQTSYTISVNEFIKFHNCVANAAFLENRCFRVTVADRYWHDIITGLSSYHLDLSVVTENLVASVGTGSGYIKKVALEWLYPATLDISNHIPDITFISLINLLKSFGYEFIPGESTLSGNVVGWENVLSSVNFEDISAISGILTDKTLSDIESIDIVRKSTTDDSYFTQNSKSLEDENTLKDSVTTFNQLPINVNVNHDIRLVETGEDKGYYEWFSSLYNISEGSNNYQGEWRFFAQEINPDGSADESIELPFSICLSDEDGARVDCPVNSINTGTVKNIGIKLFYLTFVNNRPYPDYQTPDLSLLVSGDNNISKLWERYTSWKLNRYRECKAQIQWPVWMINDFAWDKKYRIKDTNYLVKSIKFKVSYDDRIIFGETELVRT